MSRRSSTNACEEKSPNFESAEALVTGFRFQRELPSEPNHHLVDAGVGGRIVGFDWIGGRRSERAVCVAAVASLVRDWPDLKTRCVRPRYRQFACILRQFVPQYGE
jgi:hypothetical protein